MCAWASASGEPLVPRRNGRSDKYICGLL
ncbi:hypothetical protein IL54_1198 [Sphingobium sp. ba1]|nr:hypothetical protein IL54_1198 [Sphingobium sp. ba1]